MATADRFELEDYTGEKNKCDNCLKEFQDGDIIMKEKDGDHIFCDSNPFEINALYSCAMDYARAKKKPLVAHAMRFRRTNSENEEELKRHNERARKLLDF